MPAPTIIRETIVTVKDHALNQYGDLTFTDVQGQTYKISKKRTELFPVITDGLAVKLGWGNFMNKDYIAAAIQVKDGLPNPPASPPQAPVAQPSPKEPHPSDKDWIAPEQRGMWWKELGDCIRQNTIKEPMASIARKYYFIEMFRVLGIPMPEKSEKENK